MKGYAYISNSQTFHVAGDVKTAKESAFNGKTVEIDFPYAGGYPVITKGKEELAIRVEVDEKTVKIGKDTISFDTFRQEFPTIHGAVMKLI